MDLFQSISPQVCFANIWPEAVISDEESSLSSCLLCQDTFTICLAVPSAFSSAVNPLHEE